MISDLSFTTDAKLQHLGLLPLREEFMLNKAVLVFKAYWNLAPQCLRDHFICHNSRAPSRSMILLKPRIDLLKTSFSFAGASLWNYIPTQITSCSTLISFKTQLRKWLRNKNVIVMQFPDYECMYVCLYFYCFMLCFMLASTVHNLDRYFTSVYLWLCILFFFFWLWTFC